MKRRTLLTAGAAGAATLVGPGWLRRAFAQDDADGDDGRDRARELQALSDAYRAAQRAGRPLFVIVVPEDGGARWERAHAFGELLNHGGDAVFVDLSLAQVVCSTMRTLRRLVPQAPAGEPWMVVVDTASHPATARAHQAEVPEWPDHWTNELPWEEFQRRVDDSIDQRIAVMRSVVHAALARDDAMLQGWARAQEAQVGEDLARRIQAAVRAGRPDRALYAQAPAIALLAARGGRHRGTVEQALAEHTREQLHDNPVPGSRWATSGGCGVTIEGAENEGPMIACGMGHVPARSQRFLYWYNN